MPRAVLHSPNVVFLPYTRTVPGSLQLLQKQTCAQDTKKTVPHKKQGATKKTLKSTTSMTKSKEFEHQLKQTKSQQPKKEQQAKKQEKYIAETKKIEKKAQQKTESHTTAIKESKETTTIPTSTVPKKEEIVYIGQDDKIMLEAYQEIEQQLMGIWVPPLGLDEGLECTISVALDQQGKVQETKIVQSSHIITYDIAARNAAKDIRYPKIFHGKECTITFG